MYYLQWVVYHAIVVCFVNPLDAPLLYRCGYHCGYEMLILSRANIFTNFEDFFPMGRQIHLLRFMELQPQQQGAGVGVGPVVPQDLQPKVRR
jgi:hypothetical protein